MTNEQTEKIIATLEAVHSLMGQFIGTSNPHDVWRFIVGFRTGLGALGIIVDNYTFNQKIAQSRGWQWSAAGVIPMMKEKGFSDKDISDEILLIEIESWRGLLTGGANEQGTV